MDKLETAFNTQPKRDPYCADKSRSTSS